MSLMVCDACAWLVCLLFGEIKTKGGWGQCGACEKTEQQLIGPITQEQLDALWVDKLPPLQHEKPKRALRYFGQTPANRDRLGNLQLLGRLAALHGVTSECPAFAVLPGALPTEAPRAEPAQP